MWFDVVNWRHLLLLKDFGYLRCFNIMIFLPLFTQSPSCLGQSILGNLGLSRLRSSSLEAEKKCEVIIIKDEREYLPFYDHVKTLSLNREF